MENRFIITKCDKNYKNCRHKLRNLDIVPQNTHNARNTVKCTHRKPSSSCSTQTRNHLLLDEIQPKAKSPSDIMHKSLLIMSHYQQLHIFTGRYQIIYIQDNGNSIEIYMDSEPFLFLMNFYITIFLMFS